MTKQILMALALVGGMAGTASAQTITASATVATYFNEEFSQNMVFGEVQGDAVSATAAGYKDFRYNKAGITVDVTVTAQPINTATSELLSLAIQCDDTTLAGTPTLVDGCVGLTLDHAGGMADRRVWVGGTLTGMNLVSAGDYNGTITFQINNL